MLFVFAPEWDRRRRTRGLLYVLIIVVVSCSVAETWKVILLIELVCISHFRQKSLSGLAWTTLDHCQLVLQQLSVSTNGQADQAAVCDKFDVEFCYVDVVDI